MKNVQPIVDELVDAIPDCLAVCIAEIESGMCLAFKSKSPSLEPEMAAAYNAEVIKQKMKAKQALGLGGQNIEDILITLTDQYHVLSVVPGNVFFIYTATSRKSNLAMIRSIIRQHMEQLASDINV